MLRSSPVLPDFVTGNTFFVIFRGMRDTRILFVDGPRYFPLAPWRWIAFIVAGNSKLLKTNIEPRLRTGRISAFRTKPGKPTVIVPVLLHFQSVPAVPG